MQLRLASASGDSAHLCDLLVLVAFYVVQNENLSRSRRQLLERRGYVHPVAVPWSD